MLFYNILVQFCPKNNAAIAKTQPPTVQDTLSKSRDRNLFVRSEDAGVDVARSHELEPRLGLSISAVIVWCLDVLA